ncbi:hypothetical protein [Chlamydiifrater volucris]|uniref:hypothetical protein n=1 Tax=Chlamydiifrater volucris TaxID=2681470 RepID=UPI0032B2703F
MSNNIQPGAHPGSRDFGLPLGENVAEDFLSQGNSSSVSKSRLSSLLKTVKKDISGPKDTRLQARIALLVVSIIAMLTFIVGFASCVIFGLPALAVIPLVAGAVFISSIILHRSLCSYRKTIPSVRSPSPTTKVPKPSSTPKKTLPTTPLSVVREEKKVRTPALDEKITKTPLSAPTPKSHSVSTSRSKTTSSWIKVDLPPGCLAKEAFCWAHKDIPNLKLVSAKYSIDSLAVRKKFLTESSVIVNSANPTMHPGGGGTNKAISLKVTPKSWDSSKQSAALSSTPLRGPLKVGEFRAGFWESKVFVESEVLTTPTLLGQLLGPEASSSSIKGDEGIASHIVEEAYFNCVKACLQRGCLIIQTPLISSGIYAQGAKDSLAWQKMLRTAMLSGITRATKTTETKSEVLIIIVDVSTPPLRLGS